MKRTTRVSVIQDLLAPTVLYRSVSTTAAAMVAVRVVVIVSARITGKALTVLSIPAASLLKLFETTPSPSHSSLCNRRRKRKSAVRLLMARQMPADTSGARSQVLKVAASGMMLAQFPPGQVLPEFPSILASQ